MLAPSIWVAHKPSPDTSGAQILGAEKRSIPTTQSRILVVTHPIPWPGQNKHRRNHSGHKFFLRTASALFRARADIYPASASRRKQAAAPGATVPSMRGSSIGPPQSQIAGRTIGRGEPPYVVRMAWEICEQAECGRPRVALGWRAAHSADSWHETSSQVPVGGHCCGKRSRKSIQASGY